MFIELIPSFVKSIETKFEMWCLFELFMVSNFSVLKLKMKFVPNIISYCLSSTVMPSLLGS